MAQVNNDQKHMSFWSHIDELRTRLMRCLWIFLVGFVLSYSFSDWILEILRRPLFQIMPVEQQKLYFTAIFESFLVHLKVSAYGSIFFFSPFYFYELWAFVAPGLYPSERRWVGPFVTFATFFFMGGALFAYFVIFPIGFEFFLNYGTVSEVPLLTMDSYYSTVLKLLLLFGLVFEFPVLLSLLGWVGVLNPEILRQNRRTAIIGITVISAVVAPPDIVSMLLLMAPLILMYEGSIYVVGYLQKTRLKNRSGNAQPA